jgi:hypothetical protein
VLQGSKLVASKCKLYRVYLIVQEPIESAMALINAVVGSVRYHLIYTISQKNHHVE